MLRDWRQEKNKSVAVDITYDRDVQRSIGIEAAKAQCNGKRKLEDVMDHVVPPWREHNKNNLSAA
uniref:Uncharacterized protein n=1 Tax=Arundo donax TaxID=35708 RepID=A0A0A8ZYM8_ARUDO